MGDYHSDGGGGRDKTRGLFELYQDEKKAEARTRQKIHELQDNSDRVLQCKLRVIEKLLDVKVKDELAMLRKSANVAVVESDNALVRRRASERLLREVDAVVPAARDRYPDSFVTHFQSLSAVHDADLREGIRKDVQEQLDGELRPLLLRRTAAQAEQPSRVDAVDRETEGVILAGQRALLEGTTEARAASHQDRARRVREAEAKLLRPADFTPAALAELMACVPTGHGYDTGLLEAEINDLRTLIYKQRGEEEKLLLERSAQLATLEDEEGALQAEVRGLQDELTGLVEETEEKKAEAAEMRAALEPGVGRWDVEVEAARESLESLREEHLKMKRDYAELSKQVDTVDSDRRLLTDAFHEEVEDLSGLQDRYRQVVDQIEEQLFRFKEDILAVRQEDLANTRRVNELRWKASHGGEQRADTKRAFKECLNQSIGQMAIEELLQIVIQSKIVHLEEDASLLRTRWNEKLTEGMCSRRRTHTHTHAYPHTQSAPKPSGASNRPRRPPRPWTSPSKTCRTSAPACRPACRRAAPRTARSTSGSRSTSACSSGTRSCGTRRSRWPPRARRSCTRRRRTRSSSTPWGTSSSWAARWTARDSTWRRRRRRSWRRRRTGCTTT